MERIGIEDESVSCSRQQEVGRSGVCRRTRRCTRRAHRITAARPSQFSSALDGRGQGDFEAERLTRGASTFSCRGDSTTSRCTDSASHRSTETPTGRKPCRGTRDWPTRRARTADSCHQRQIAETWRCGSPSGDQSCATKGMPSSEAGRGTDGLARERNEMHAQERRSAVSPRVFA